MENKFLSRQEDADESAKRRAELLQKYVMPHKNLIYRICINYTFNREDIEDNYVDVLVNFFKYIDTYNPNRPVKTWIYAVAKRLVSDLNKRHSKRGAASDNVDVELCRSSILSDDDSTYTCMSIENYREYYGDDVLWALDKLKDIYRETLLLQLAGYTVNEIMDITYEKGLLQTRNPETVKSRLFLAKAQLRKMLTRDGERRCEEADNTKGAANKETKDTKETKGKKEERQ